MRLAFAVAAHLEPEILIVDEVLAVGDAQFQKKCLGKMGDVAKEGRTVLFVSHNMAAVSNLCRRGLVLEQGRVAFAGTQTEAVARYLTSNGAGGRSLRDTNRPRGQRRGARRRRGGTATPRAGRSTWPLRVRTWRSASATRRRTGFDSAERHRRALRQDAVRRARLPATQPAHARRMGVAPAARRLRLPPPAPPAAPGGLPHHLQPDARRRVPRRDGGRLRVDGHGRRLLTAPAKSRPRRTAAASWTRAGGSNRRRSPAELSETDEAVAPRSAESPA